MRKLRRTSEKALVDLVWKVRRHEKNQKLPSGREKAEIYPSEIWRTALPSNLPARNSSSAVLASSSGKGWVFVFTGTHAAISRNSSPSRRVKFATEQMARSPQRST